MNNIVPTKNKKTNRKNKTNLTIDWLSGIFSIEDLASKNPQFVKITLRVRLKNSISDGMIAEIGTVHSGKGRPKKMYSMTPVTKKILEKAAASNVQLNEKYNIVPIVNVNTKTSNNNDQSNDTYISTNTGVDAPNVLEKIDA